VRCADLAGGPLIQTTDLDKRGSDRSLPIGGQRPAIRRLNGCASRSSPYNILSQVLPENRAAFG
jgi:hypothetical protein